MALVHAQAEFALEQWGIWCRTATPGPKGAISWMGPMVDRMVGQIVEADERPVRAWEDNDCEAFDAHVVRHIRENNIDAYEAIKAYYAFPDGDDYRALSKTVLAKRLRVNRDTAVKRLEIGINMVAAMLAMAA
ncbi:hypothetical protein [uncultured Alcanivorax sp.]|uniref:hypothetical protein n=1 Tax=uncultured Alcanivorax sp. TaxID=191215 RepID=UPI0032B251D7